MLYGKLVDGQPIVSTGQDGCLPIQETAEPADIPHGYHAECSFRETGGAIVQMWTVVPDAGTTQEATVTLAQLQAAALSDEDALKVPALYPEWTENAVAYAKGDRVLHGAVLYRAAKAHTSSAESEPGTDGAPWEVVGA